MMQRATLLRTVMAALKSLIKIGVDYLTMYTFVYCKSMRSNPVVMCCRVIKARYRVGGRQTMLVGAPNFQIGGLIRHLR